MLGVVFIITCSFLYNVPHFSVLKPCFIILCVCAVYMISFLSLASLTQYHYGIFAEDIFGNETVASVLTVVEYYCISMHSVSDADSI